MIFPSWFRWLVFRIVLDGFWRQYITTVWYLRERIHLHRSSWGLDVALMFVRRCLIFVLCRLHRSIITARQQQLRSNSLGTRSRLCFPLPACRSCFGLSPALRCCLPYGLYYHRWSCQCKKFLFARVTHLLKLLDAIFGCFRLAISFRHWTSFRWQLSQRCDRCLCAASIRWVVLVWVLMLLLVSGSLLQVWSSSIRIAETFATAVTTSFQILILLGSVMC